METIQYLLCICLLKLEEFFTPALSNEDSNESFWENYSTDYRIFINLSQ